MFRWALMEPSSPHLTMEPRGLQGLLGNQTVFKELSTQTVPSRQWVIPEPSSPTTNRSELFSPILFPRHVRWVYRSMDKKIKR